MRDDVDWAPVLKETPQFKPFLVWDKGRGLYAEPAIPVWDELESKLADRLVDRLCRQVAARQSYRYRQGHQGHGRPERRSAEEGRGLRDRVARSRPVKTGPRAAAARGPTECACRDRWRYPGPRTARPWRSGSAGLLRINRLTLAKYCLLLPRPASGLRDLLGPPVRADRPDLRPELLRLAPDPPAETVRGVRQLPRPVAGRQLPPGLEEHHPLRRLRGRGERGAGPGPGRPPGRESPRHGRLSGHLLPAGDHPHGPHGHCLEVDLRRPLRDPQLRPLLVRGAAHRVADLPGRGHVGHHHHERVEGAGLQHGPPAGRPEEHPGGVTTRLPASTGRPGGPCSAASPCPC